MIMADGIFWRDRGQIQMLWSDLRRTVRIGLLFVFIVALSSCSEDRRARDMGRFFSDNLHALSQLNKTFQQLQTNTGIRGLDLEREIVYLVRPDTLSIDKAIQRFSAYEKEITEAWNSEKRLGLRKAYIMADSSFWVIVDETDVMGSDYGFFREGTKPISHYRILNKTNPMAEAKGWHQIRF
ncbi:MAG: hypothetical protein HQL53_01180 [Magnetococcales bacterium]|nr:hypothetical protein [Magnetococcales bacterium]